ncbi:MAG: PAS domain S-box protein [Candidatus Obscuribacterales bacterium]|nr:PAS domain S-box protein [Cyanobacteria bacterium HKST-UBA01]MCB9472077.1 PAS domain S-box protein [Candidatus Obscuribacterales bacterium]
MSRKKQLAGMKSTFDSMPVPILWGESPVDMTCSNEAFSVISGLGEDELGGSSWTVCLNSRVRKGTLELLTLAEANGEEVTFEIEIKKGRKQRHELIAFLKRSTSQENLWFILFQPRITQSSRNNLVGSLIDSYSGKFSTDLSADKSSSSLSGSYPALSLGDSGKTSSPSNYELSRVVELSVDAIITFSLNGLIESWNDGATSLYGFSAEEAVGRDLSLIVPIERKDEIDELLVALKEDRLVEAYETIRLTRDNKVVHVSLVVSPLKDVTGRVIAGFSIARDITRRKQAEEALLSQAHQLAKTNVELEKLAWMVAHDLKEPIRTMTTYAHLVADELSIEADSDIGAMLAFMTQAGLRATDRIQDVLTYGSLGKKDFAMEMTDMNNLVQRVLADLQRVIEDRGARIEVEKLPKARVNRSTISLLFQNLISNAIKFSEPNQAPLVKIACKKQGQGLIFEVSDSGIGIGESAGDKVFDMFSRLEPNTYPGTGIGLAICKKVVELHGGSIWYDSGPRKGTTFYFSIALEQ